MGGGSLIVLPHLEVDREFDFVISFSFVCDFVISLSFVWLSV
jgi:hypothetical protein